MKEKGMEKLIKLLDEYDSVQYHKINHKIENGSIYRNVGGTDGWHEVWRYCKQFGFIKRLVDNDKIDINEINNNHLDVEIFYKQTYGPNYGEGGYGEIDYWYKCIGLYESLLCNLAISDTPIEDLISYLK